LPPDPLPKTGTIAASLASLDDQIEQQLRSYDVPGCSLSISHHGKLIAQRGYGWADIKSNQPVQPDSLFRIASVSKVLTAVAALKLCDEHKLTLNTKAFPLLAYPPFPSRVRMIDPHLNEITVTHLLQSTAGWNRERSGDPLFSPNVQLAAEELSPTLRATPDDIIRYWTNNHQLDCTPGTTHVYSNLCYTILGRVVAKSAGTTYSEYVLANVLKPLDIKGLRLGKTLVRAPHEVTHYPFAGQELGHSVFPNYLLPVPLPYGGDYSMEALEADTGWIGTPSELVKFTDALFESQTPFLSPKMQQFMIARPPISQWEGARDYFACGWEIATLKSGKTIIYKRGSLPGSMAFVAHRSDGFSAAWAVNSRPYRCEAFEDQLTLKIWQAIDSIASGDKP
jgi:N-acyl-D-amino-acid deacylase